MKQENQNAYQLFEALSGVDADLLERSEKRVEKKVIPFRRFAYVAVACICLVAVGATIYLQPGQKAGTKGMRSESTSLADLGMLEENATTKGTAESEAAAKGFARTEADEISADACDIDAAEGGAVEEAPAVADRSEYKNEMETARLDDAQAGTEGADADELKQFVDKMMMNNSINRMDSLEQVQEMLAPYFPEVPVNYQWEGASESDGTTTVVWSKGMQDIWWSVSKVNPADIACVDIHATERYDVHLYEIPYCDTVPAEYIEDFQNPIFAAEDLDITVLERRIKAAQDAGDASKLRGDFSVLFSDGTLVRYNGCGSAKEVWSMLKPMFP